MKQLLKKLAEALKATQEELYMIHSQYGDKEHARKHSMALRQADEVLAEYETDNGMLNMKTPSAF